MILKRQTRIGIWTVALLTAIVGVVNMLSAVTPNLHQRVKWLEEFFPFNIREVSHYGHLFAALSGFFLLVLATNLLRRKRVAWLLAVILLIISIVSHLIKGLDYEEALLSLVLLIQLIIMRGAFTARSDLPSIAQGVRLLIGALLFTLAYGTAGFYLLDRHYQIDFDFWGALRQTLAMFLTEDSAGLRTTTRFGRFFADSIYLVSAVTFLFALFMLLRPVLLRGSLATAAERRQATAIVEAYGKSSLARFTLFDDKARYKNKTMQQVVIYLKQTTSELVYETAYVMERTRHEFDVVRLWEQPPSLFLQYPGLLPFAALGQTANPAETLRQATQIVDRIEDTTTQANPMAASGILAGLKLEDEVVYRILRRDIMQESTVYRSIQRETQVENSRAIALNLLRRGVAIDIIAPSTGLSIEEVQRLQQQLNESP
jgi:hypothetical protein